MGKLYADDVGGANGENDVEDGGDAAWAPLERLARLTRESESLDSIAACEFMFMTRVGRRRPRPSIYLYKHIFTRRYLNLDAAGHAYRYIGPRDIMSDYRGRYVPHRTLAAALHHLELWLAEDEWREERLAACPDHEVSGERRLGVD